MSKDYEFLTKSERIIYLRGNESLDVEKIDKRCRKAKILTFQTPSNGFICSPPVIGEKTKYRIKVQINPKLNLALMLDFWIV